jgi:hypothetical protein
MATPEVPAVKAANSWSRLLKGGCLVMAAAFVAGACLMLVGLAKLSSDPGGLWPAVKALLAGPTHLDMSQPAVVEKIQRMQRLETVVYAVDKVVSGGHESSILPDFLAGDKMLMLVHGEVVAGVDFGSLGAGDVTVNGKKVTLHLPAAQVFSTRLDNEKTKVYSRDTGLLVPTDPNLETQVRQEAEKQIHDAALAEGILKTADANGRATLTSLLQGLGFAEVEFR